jgi:hypothetical protein
MLTIRWQTASRPNSGVSFSTVISIRKCTFKKPSIEYGSNVHFPMEFEDDFIESSDGSPPEEDTANSSFFLTATQGQVPTVLPLLPAKPVADILAMTSLTRTLISALSSLISFGKSSIGTTVPGTIYDLAPRLTQVRERLPAFMADIRKMQEAPQFRLLKQYDQLKRRWTQGLQVHAKLKNMMHANGRALREHNDRDDALESLRAETRATAVLVRNSIIRLQQSHAVVDDLQLENETLRSDISERQSALNRNCRGAIGSIQKSLVKLEVDLACSAPERAAAIAAAEDGIAVCNQTLRALQARLENLDARIAGRVK